MKILEEIKQINEGTTPSKELSDYAKDAIDKAYVALKKLVDYGLYEDDYPNLDHNMREILKIMKEDRYSLGDSAKRSAKFKQIN